MESQREIIEPHATQMLPDILSASGTQRVALVTGQASFEACGAQAIIEPALSTHTTIRISDFDPNPSIDDVQSNCELISDFCPDVFVAVGGGSVIDMAKSVALLHKQTQQAIDYVRGEAHVAEPSTPVIAIPTTAGSGSEATHFAVVYIDDEKYSLAHTSMIPHTAIVDPLLTLSMPSSLTAVSGMDALSQAIESFWSVHSTIVSREYARQAIPLILGHIRFAVNEPQVGNRIAMSRAAHLAGKAINIAKTTACHALSYRMTKKLNIPHGHAVGLTLGAMLEYNSAVSDQDVVDPRGTSQVRDAVDEIINLLGAHDAAESMNSLYELMADIGLTTSFSQLGLENGTLDDIAAHANSARTANNPRQFTQADARQLLEHIANRPTDNAPPNAST